MGEFLQTLAARNPDAAGRRWQYVPYDQLSLSLGPLADEDRASLGIILIENPAKGDRRPYHKQKLALLLTNQRHFALEAAEAGVAVRYKVADASYAATLRDLADELGPLRMMEAAERELRIELAELVEDGLLEILPHDGWLTTGEDFDTALGNNKHWRMDFFYRHVRRTTGILMEDDEPVGGKFSFDAENREPWRGQPEAPEPPRFPVDDITAEVCDLVETKFSNHPGRIDPARIPATREDARALWDWAKAEAMPHFGPYEDAMSTKSRTLFHTQISSVLNLHRITPREVLDEVLALDVPLASQEGFVRQVLGWREFVRHVHRKTDGFRTLKGERSETSESAGDGGYERWLGREWHLAGERGPLSGSALPNTLNAHTPIPPAYWGAESGLHCLDSVIQDVWDTGYGHHITRLMVLSNLATLLDVDPRELTDWFWVAYTDAYDWVVEPNVLAMGTFATGNLMTTKPYVSGAAYIDRMGDYCAECRFHPKKDCPITSMYWAFLDRHQEELGDNPRLSLPYRSLARRAESRLQQDHSVSDRVRGLLCDGEPVTPESLSAVAS